MTAHRAGYWPKIPASPGGGGGFTDDGTVVRLTTANDNVALGVATMSGTEKLRVQGAGGAAKGVRIDEASASSGALLELVGAAARTGVVVDIQMATAVAGAHGIKIVNSAANYANSLLYLECTAANALGPGSAGSIVDIYKQPASAADGEGITIQFNANTTGMGFEMTHAGSGVGQLITKTGNALALSVQKSSGSGTTVQFQKSGGTAALVLEIIQGTAQAGMQIYTTAVGASCAQFLDLVNNNTATRLVQIQNNRQGSTADCLEINKVPATSATGGRCIVISTGANATGNVVDVDHAGSGRLVYLHTGATLLFAIAADGKQEVANSNTQTTVGAAGAASALPATPSGYEQFKIGSTTFVRPYYAAA